MNWSLDSQLPEAYLHKLAAIFTERLFKGLAIPDVLKMYADLRTPRENLERNGIDPNFQYDRYGDRIIQPRNINARLNGLHNIGIDLPVGFTAPDSKSTLMLLGMEPRRRDNIGEQCTIASPFGLYRPSQNSSGHRIMSFVRQLWDDHYSVYVTDISKVYAEQRKYKYIGEPADPSCSMGRKQKIL